MTIEITLDNLDEAIKKLQDLSRQLERFPTEVAYESMENVRYNDATPLLITTNGSHIIKNVGDQIAFQEFGAGFSAQIGDFGDFHTEPGIWSEDHARTYQNWRGDMEDYPYNRPAQRKMQIEVERLRNDTERKAKDYFG